MRGARARHSKALACGAMVVGLVLGAFTNATLAGASFSSAGAAATTMASGSVKAPTALSASSSCHPTNTLTVTWTAPTGNTPTGYEIYVTKNGVGPTSEGTASGTSTSATFSITKSITYTVSIETNLHSWVSSMSTSSNSASC